jgi:hypothetical protein
MGREFSHDFTSMKGIITEHRAFIFLWSRFYFSARIPAIPTGVFRSFLESHRSNAGRATLP